jgi:hypothetical protein
VPVKSTVVVVSWANACATKANKGIANFIIFY